jgi:hypothetical protein
MADIWTNLISNKWHKKGDTKPCLVSYKATIKVEEPGEYTVAIWAPKEGKNTYSMKLIKVVPEGEQKTDTKETSTKPVQQAVKPAPIQHNPMSLFKRR